MIKSKNMRNKISPDKKRIVLIDDATIKKLKESVREESQTIVHCNYVSKRKYINGGWVNIYPTTFLQSNKNSDVLKMQHAENIPMSPDVHVFSKVGELKSFVLYFPAIPKDWDEFSLVEKTTTAEGFVVRNIKRNNIGVYEIYLS